MSAGDGSQRSTGEACEPVALIGDLPDHGHPAGECCEAPDCRQAYEMYPEG